MEHFEKNLKDNLYKIWNRLSSGSYFPPPVKAVLIPKKKGGMRILGVPTVGDRIAQMVVTLQFTPCVEPHFLEDSYGYRPNKSALDAIEVTRRRCWKYDWVLEFDIKRLFDNIPHELLMKAVRKHTSCKWVILNIKRWLQAPIQLIDGQLSARDKGTPQGGVISPILSNLFMHYVFDAWMRQKYPDKPCSRYADDGLVHLKTEREAQAMLLALKERFEECGLELHSKKTQIVYCKPGRANKKYPNRTFDFLGYTFASRWCKSRKTNKMFVGFTPSVSKASLKAMRAKTRKRNVRNRTDLSLQELAKWYNPVLQGWLNYYGRFTKSGLYPIWRHFNNTLISWVRRKYKHFRSHKTKSSMFIQKIAKRQSDLFVHWRQGMFGEFV